MKFHLSPKTGAPAICNAQINCPISGEHFETLAEAEQSIEKNLAKDYDIFSTLSKIEVMESIELSSNIGEANVINGDLSDPKARALLSSGLCGDLALAIHRKTGGYPYFLSYVVGSEENLLKKFKEDPENIFRFTNHVVLESPTKLDHFVDAYGQNDSESLKENWDGAQVIKGTPEMLEYYASSKSADRLDKFAETALELDREGVSFEVDDDLIDFDIFEEDFDEDFE